MFIPDGYDEAQILAIIEKAVWPLAETMKFGHYDACDMFQEGFIHANDVLQKYNKDNIKGCSLENFIRIHVRNRFINMRRDRLYRTSFPCLSCCETCVDNIMDCPKYVAWLRRNNAKRSIMEAAELEDMCGERVDMLDKLWKREFLEYVMEHISIVNRSSLLKLLDDTYLIKKKKTELIEELKILYMEFNHGIEEDE